MSCTIEIPIWGHSTLKGQTSMATVLTSCDESLPICKGLHKVHFDEVPPRDEED